MSTLLQVKNISKRYGNQVVLNDVDFFVREKQRLGVVGRNGAGKSTLMKIITGDETADSGEVTIFDEANLGYLRQEDNFLESEKVLEYLLRVSQKDEWQCAKVASRFGLREVELNSTVTDLSGGYQMRVKLTAMLLREPNLLLLDEPTNYLDMSTMLLLEDFLNDYRGAFMIISHDREFLENVCDETLEVESGNLYFFPGNLTQYENAKREKLETDQKFNKKQEAKEKHLQDFVDRFRYKASKSKQAQMKIKQIEKIQKISISKKLANVYIKLPNVDAKSGLAVRIDGLEIGYGKTIIADDIDIDIERGEHLAVLGDNGEGKSTFIKTLAEKIEKLGGVFRWMPNINVAYYAQYVSKEMNTSSTVEAYLAYSAGKGQRNEDILRMASNFLFRDDDLKKTISMLSGGEKARLCLAGILLNENNVLLLDEPNNHLDFTTVEALGRALKETNATVLFISHDRTFVNMVADGIIEVRGGNVKRYIGDYDDYIDSLRERASLQNVEEMNQYRVEDKAEKRANFEKMKVKKKKIAKLDKQIVKLKADRQEVLDLIEKDLNTYSKEHYARLKIVEDELAICEQEWLEVNK